MPWNNPNISRMSYEEAKDITYADVMVIEADAKLKQLIQSNFPALAWHIHKAIATEAFDPNVQLYPELKSFLEQHVLTHEIPGDESIVLALTEAETAVQKMGLQ